MTDLEKQKFTLYFSSVDDYKKDIDFDMLLEHELIHEIEVDGISELMKVLVDSATIGEVVYLATIFDEVFVSDHLPWIVVPIKALIKEEITSNDEANESISVHLFECTSYEDAYKTALDMQEQKELCYEKK